MMVDFALDAERNQGMSPGAGDPPACLLRFRPIMMTTMAHARRLPFASAPAPARNYVGRSASAIVAGLVLSQFLRSTRPR